MNSTEVKSGADSMLVTAAGFFPQVYAWMTAGLFITAAIAFMINVNQALMNWLFFNDWVIFVVFILEVLVVIGLSALIERLNTVVAAALFAFYAALNGVFFGIVVSFYTAESVFAAFAATAGTFLVMTIYGLTTKADLTRWGQLAIMGLFGLIVGFIVNFFLQSDSFSWFMTYVGIGIFIILIAYDTQKLKHYEAMAEQSGSIAKYAIFGALELYLDFINLFIRLLRVMGKRR